MWATVLIATTFLAYWPALDAGYIWDDDAYVTENLALRSWEGLRAIWFQLGATPQYYPLVFTSFWIEHHFWGNQPLGYHAVNIALHALGSVLLMMVIFRLGLNRWIALLVAAIFALHPIHVESVAWVSERKNVLSTVFYFAAILAYDRFDPVESESVSPHRNWSLYIAALLLFVCALASKTVTCTLPAAILLVTWWKRGRISPRDILHTAPFFAIGICAGLLTANMERHFVGASGAEWNYSIPERILIAGRALWFYLAKFFWPMNLAFIYERWTIRTTSLWPWLFPISAAMVIITLWLARARIGRGPVTAALYFAGTLFPALGFLNVYPFRFSFVADHFQHLASLGPTIAIAAIIIPLARTLSRNFVITISILTITTLAVLTFGQCRIYHDAETLWRDTISKNNSAFIAHHHLGVILESRDQPYAALEQYQQAYHFEPRNFESLNNAGILLERMGQPRDALTCFQRAIAIAPPRAPGSAELHVNLARTLLSLGDRTAAIQELRTAVALSPGDQRIITALARLEAATQPAASPTPPREPDDSAPASRPNAR